MRRIFQAGRAERSGALNSNVPLRIKLFFPTDVTSDSLIDVAALHILNSEMNVTNIVSFIIALFMLTAPLNSATLIVPASNGEDLMGLFQTLMDADGWISPFDARLEDLSEPPNQWNWTQNLTVSGTTSATFGICSEAAVLCDSSAAEVFGAITFSAHEIGAWLDLPGDYQADVKLWLTEIEQNRGETTGQSGDAPEPPSLYLTAAAFGLAAAHARSKLSQIRVKRGVPLCRSS